MARYTYIDTNTPLITVDLARRLLPGTCEHAVHHLLDHDIDLSGVDARFRDDTTGAPAYTPALLLTVVLVADAHRSISRRAIEAAPLTAAVHRWRSGATEPDAGVPVTVNDANHADHLRVGLEVHCVRIALQKHASQAASNDRILLRGGRDQREGLIDCVKEPVSRRRGTLHVPIERRLDLLACPRANAQGQHLAQLAREGQVNVGPGIARLRRRVGVGFTAIQIGAEFSRHGSSR